MFFLGYNFASGLLCTLKSKTYKQLENLKKTKNVFRKNLVFYSPGQWPGWSVVATRVCFAAL